MFWRAARGRVGPNSRSVLHMAIFLLNPYGLYACILIPKLLASPPELSGFANSPELSKFARKARTPVPAVGPLPRAGSHMPVFASLTLAESVARRLQYIIWPSTPHFWYSLRSRQISAPNNVCQSRGKRSEHGHLTYVEKYDIIFKKRVCVRRWRLGHLTILKKCDIINKKTSTANRFQCGRIWLDFHKKLWYNKSR